MVLILEEKKGSKLFAAEMKMARINEYKVIKYQVTKKISRKFIETEHATFLRMCSVLNRTNRRLKEEDRLILFIKE